MKQIITIVGARPQFIKAAVVSHQLLNYPNLTETIVHTGQHFDANMSEIFFEQMSIPKPHYQLAVNNLDHGAMTGRMLEQIETILKSHEPDLILVYGDTNSTLAGALAARKLNIPVAHVEAGLRSKNMEMPEEINRILTDRISDLLFCPTQSAVDNLIAEGYQALPVSIHHSGDVMEDAAMFYAQKINKGIVPINLPHLPDHFILATIHRQENTDDPQRLKSLINALNLIHKKVPVVIPMHPRTSKKLNEFGIIPKFKTIEPVGYLEMIALLEKTDLVITDSGGLQKEAYFFNKFCITLRNETEWIELVEHKYNYIFDEQQSDLIGLIDTLLGSKFPIKQNLFGGGEAGRKIAKTLSNTLN